MQGFYVLLMKFLVACLGNIGQEYELTRHNLGFLTADRLADQFKVEFEQTRLAFKALIKYKGRQIHVIKPATYMNLSGKAINFWLQELKLDTARLIVVTDDIALPFGKLRMRPQGSDAGHNGLKNIENTLGTRNYPRLRMGVGNEFSKGQQTDYVLSNFTREELDQLPPIMDKAGKMILSFATTGIERTMNVYND